jgi:hypothetical protein
VGERLAASGVCGFIALMSADSPLISLIFGGLAVAALFIDD